jgi:8-oxo-dGTP diphosphatase
MEYLDIRTSDGKVTGQVKERTLVHQDGDLHGTSHVWIIRHKENQRFDILLQKRAAGKDAYAGCYDISSAGHIPAGQDYRESAIRELEEELGIKAEPAHLKFIGMHDGMMEAEFYGKPFKNHELSAVYIYEEPVQLADFKLQAEEVESVMWIDFDECRQKLWTGEIRNCIFYDEFKMLEKAVRGDHLKE